MLEGIYARRSAGRPAVVNDSPEYRSLVRRGAIAPYTAYGNGRVMAEITPEGKKAVERTFRRY